MAQGKDNPPIPQDNPPVAGGGGAPPWSQLWQGPALVLGILCFVAAVALIALDRKLPEINGVLDQAATSLKAGDVEGARAILSQVRPRVDKAGELVRGRFAQLQGDLLHTEQQANGWDVPANHQQIADFYAQAQKLGVKPDADHLARWAEAMIGLDRYDDAGKMIDANPEPAARVRVLRKLIVRQQTHGAAAPETIAALLNRLTKEVAKEKEAATRREQEIWAVQTRAGTMLDAGQFEAAADYLQQQLFGLMSDNKDDDLQALFAMLARAYERAGNLAAAQPQYLRVVKMSDPTRPRDAEALAQALVGLGRITLAQAGASATPQDVSLALEYFAKAAADFANTASHVDALLGRADCEARLGHVAEALDHVRQVVRKLAEAPKASPVQVEQVVKMARAQSVRHADQNEYDVALEFLKTLVPLYRDEWPDDVLEQLADAHVKLAQQKQDAARTIREAIVAGKSEAAPALSGAPDPQARADQLALDAGRLLDIAGDLYLKHARQITAREIKPYSQSLWNAAGCYQRALQWKKAIEVLSQFERALPADEHHLECMLQLAQAYMQEGQNAAAVDILRRLIVEHPGKEHFPALVPLARAYIALQQHDDAKRVLAGVVTDHPAIKPESMEYRQALMDLGRLLYRLKEFEPAIERLTEAVDRYGQGAEGTALKYTLADAYRQSAGQLAQMTRQPQLPAAKRQALAAERARRLEVAQQLYDKVITELDARPEPSLSDPERLYQRNAYMYRADCAYDLGRFEQAIMLYGIVSNKFSQSTTKAPHPVALMAQVQIVNAYCEQGKLQEARAANKLAQDLFKRIPAEAFDDPSLPMNRQLWSDWLRFTSEFNLFPERSGVPTPPAPRPTPTAAPSPAKPKPAADRGH